MAAHSEKYKLVRICNNGVVQNIMIPTSFGNDSVSSTNTAVTYANVSPIFTSIDMGTVNTDGLNASKTHPMNEVHTEPEGTYAAADQRIQNVSKRRKYMSSEVILLDDDSTDLEEDNVLQITPRLETVGHPVSSPSTLSANSNERTALFDVASSNTSPASVTSEPPTDDTQAGHAALSSFGLLHKISEPHQSSDIEPLITIDRIKVEQPDTSIPVLLNSFSLSHESEVQDDVNDASNINPVATVPTVKKARGRPRKQSAVTVLGGKQKRKRMTVKVLHQQSLLPKSVPSIKNPEPIVFYGMGASSIPGPLFINQGLAHGSGSAPVVINQPMAVHSHNQMPILMNNQTQMPIIVHDGSSNGQMPLFFNGQNSLSTGINNIQLFQGSSLPPSVNNQIPVSIFMNTRAIVPSPGAPISVQAHPTVPQGTLCNPSIHYVQNAVHVKSPVGTAVPYSYVVSGRTLIRQQRCNVVASQSIRQPTLSSSQGTSVFRNSSIRTEASVTATVPSVMGKPALLPLIQPGLHNPHDDPSETCTSIVFNDKNEVIGTVLQRSSSKGEAAKLPLPPLTTNKPHKPQTMHVHPATSTTNTTTPQNPAILTSNALSRLSAVSGLNPQVVTVGGKSLIILQKDQSKAALSTTAASQGILSTTKTSQPHLSAPDLQITKGSNQTSSVVFVPSSNGCIPTMKTLLSSSHSIVQSSSSAQSAETSVGDNSPYKLAFMIKDGKTLPLLLPMSIGEWATSTPKTKVTSTYTQPGSQVTNPIIISEAGTTLPSAPVLYQKQITSKDSAVNYIKECRHGFHLWLENITPDSLQQLLMEINAWTSKPTPDHEALVYIQMRQLLETLKQTTALAMVPTYSTFEQLLFKSIDTIVTLAPKNPQDQNCAFVGLTAFLQHFNKVCHWISVNFQKNADEFKQITNVFFDALCQHVTKFVETEKYPLLKIFFLCIGYHNDDMTCFKKTDVWKEALVTSVILCCFIQIRFAIQQSCSGTKSKSFFSALLRLKECFEELSVFNAFLLSLVQQPLSDYYWNKLVRARNKLPRMYLQTTNSDNCKKRATEDPGNPGKGIESEQSTSRVLSNSNDQLREDSVQHTKAYDADVVDDVMPVDDDVVTVTFPISRNNLLPKSIANVVADVVTDAVDAQYVEHKSWDATSTHETNQEHGSCDYSLSVQNFILEDCKPSFSRLYHQAHTDEHKWQPDIKPCHISLLKLSDEAVHEKTSGRQLRKRPALPKVKYDIDDDDDAPDNSDQDFRPSTDDEESLLDGTSEDSDYNPSYKQKASKLPKQKKEKRVRRIKRKDDGKQVAYCVTSKQPMLLPDGQTFFISKSGHPDLLFQGLPLSSSASDTQDPVIIPVPVQTVQLPDLEALYYQHLPISSASNSPSSEFGK